MFPLGSAFLPGEVVPLRVFEPRYVAMMRDLLAHDTEVLTFGSVLIERGVEVGGHDLRRQFGVYVDIDHISATPEGGYSLLGRATSVLRVDEWGDDDPYPRAVTSVVAVSCDESVASLASTVSRLAQSARVLLHEYFDAEGVPTSERSLPELTRVASGSWVTDAQVEEVGRAAWVVGRHVPVGPEDRYGLLSASSLGERVRRIAETIAHASEVLAFRRRPSD